jgi:hypothetical protein
MDSARLSGLGAGFVFRSIIRAGVGNFLVKLYLDFFWVHLVTVVDEGMEEVLFPPDSTQSK